MTVLMRELNIYTLIGDMLPDGRQRTLPSSVMMRSPPFGVLDSVAFDILHKLDQQFARLENVIGRAAAVSSGYPIRPWPDRRGDIETALWKDPGGYVQELMTSEFRVEAAVDSDESYGTIDAFLTDTITNENSGATR